MKEKRIAREIGRDRTSGVEKEEQSYARTRRGSPPRRVV